MKIKEYIKRPKALLLLVATLGASSQAVQAWDPSSSQDPDVLRQTQDQEMQVMPDEEVIVVGDATPTFLWREAHRVQNQLYQMFNEYNTQDEFDMVCKKEALIGSQIRRERCLPRFYRTAVSEASTDRAENAWVPGPSSDLNRPELVRKYWRQRELMAEFANQNPEFLQLLKKRKAYRVAYEKSLSGKKARSRAHPRNEAPPKETTADTD